MPPTFLARTLPLIFAVAPLSGCDRKDPSTDRPAAPTVTSPPSPPTATAVTPPPSPPPSAVAPPPGPAAELPMGDDAVDPLEVGLDRAWREDEGCKRDLDDADRRFAHGFRALCLDAMANVAACLADPALVAKVEATQDRRGALRDLKRLTASAQAIAETCDGLGRDYFCDYQGRMWSEPYTPAELRALAAAPRADCAAVAAALPRPLHPTSE